MIHPIDVAAFRAISNAGLRMWHHPLGHLDFLQHLPEIFEEPVLDEELHAPFPAFGGKRRAAAIIWDRFGDVVNMVEPFSLSCAVTLARPAWHKARVETCNDVDALVVNFWRATAFDPENVARLVDWPVFEVDLHARHRWLIARRATLAQELEADPRAYDLEAAAWWAWGASAWIGAGWCAESQASNRKRPSLGGDGGERPGGGVHAQGQRGPSRGAIDLAGGNGAGAAPKDGKGVHGGDQRAPSKRLPDLSGGTLWDSDDANARAGKGLHGAGMRAPSRKIPNLIGGQDEERATPQPGHGVHAGPMREISRQLPDLGGSSRGEDRWPNTGKGINGARERTALSDTFHRLAARLRYVRFACGDWKRVVTPAVTWRHGPACCSTHLMARAAPRASMRRIR